MATLRLDQVGRVYPGPTPVHALDDVSLSVAQGEFVAIEGPSGGGKSTMLNIIGLLDVPTQGRYLVGESDTVTLTSRQIAELRSDRFAFIFQSFHLLDRRPVIDSVELALLYRKVPRAERTRLALDALTKVGLTHLATQKANKLSGGERQRVAIARALATNAPIVVADEPTGNLDSENSQRIVESLKTLHDQGSTIVLVTHSPDVASAAQRRLHIRDGRLDGGAEKGPARESATTAALPAPAGVASRVALLDVMRDAFASLTSRVARSLGLVLAVAFGVGLAVTTLGLSVSAEGQVSDTFNAHANREVTVQWAPTAIAVETASVRRSIPPRLLQLSGTTAAGILTDHGDHTLQPSTDREAVQVSTFGMTSGFPRAGRLAVRWAPGRTHTLSGSEVLVGANLASQLHLGPLEGDPVLLVDNREVTVAGVVEASPRFPQIMGSVVATESAATALGPAVRETAFILTVAGAAQQVARQAPLVVDPYDPSSLEVSAPVDPTTLRTQVETDLQTLLLAFTGVAVLASVAGLTNAMVLSVLERRQEFGLRRAIGARPSHIAGLVLTESTFIGMLGGVCGLVGGLAALLVITLVRHWAPVFDFRLAPVAIVGGIAAGALGGLLASFRASRIQPNEALRL